LLPLLAIPFPPLDPVIVQIGPFALRWYALAYVAGLLLSWVLIKRLIRRPGWQVTPEQIDDLLFYITLGVVLGGRIGYILFYNFPYYAANPMAILEVWQGGMSFHGGLIGVITAIILFARRHQAPLFDVADAVSSVAPLGLLLGRLANFVNGELYGRVTDVPWGVIFPHGGPLPRHPSQLYEAFLEGVVLLALTQLAARGERTPDRRGRISGVFLTGYALARFLVEFAREPDAQLGYLVGGLTMGQLLCIPMFLLGVALLARSTRAPAAGASAP
jgi:phosphatidylglycerol:prolipoprotein diacylglycerol transferase